MKALSLCKTNLKQQDVLTSSGRLVTKSLMTFCPKHCCSTALVASGNWAQIFQQNQRSSFLECVGVHFFSVYLNPVFVGLLSLLWQHICSKKENKVVVFGLFQSTGPCNSVLDFCWGSPFAGLINCLISMPLQITETQIDTYLFLCHKVHTVVHRVTALSGIGVHLTQRRGLRKCLKANTVSHRQAGKQALLIQPTD